MIWIVFEVFIPTFAGAMVAQNYFYLPINGEFILKGDKEWMRDISGEHFVLPVLNVFDSQTYQSKN